MSMTRLVQYVFAQRIDRGGPGMTPDWPQAYPALTRFYLVADVDALLRQREEEVAQYSQEAADLKAQLREESQFSLERQGIIDGLRSERSRHTEVVDKLRSGLAAMTAERDALRKAQKNLAGQYNSLSQQLAASQARCVQLEEALTLSKIAKGLKETPA